jgi:glycerol-3-phosphate dehydrogenase
MSMRYGVLGTGQVGRALAGRLVDVGHEVRMGSRTSDNEAAAAWVAVKPGANLTIVTFGALVQKSLQAAVQVEQQNPRATVEVIDLRTLNPYDWAAIATHLRPGRPPAASPCCTSRTCSGDG